MAVLYTTHYMEEAERLCDRVGIIDEGKIIAEGTRRELVDKVGQLDRVEIAAKGALKRFATAAKKAHGRGRRGDVRGRRPAPRQRKGAAASEAARVATHSKLDVSSVEVIEPDLEAVFLHLTGKALRD